MSKKLLLLGLSLLGVASINLVACQNAAPSNALVIGMECAYQPFNWTQNYSSRNPSQDGRTASLVHNRSVVSV